VGLYLHVHPDDNITSVEVAVLLRALLRHLRGQVVVLVDGGSIHKGPEGGRCWHAVPVCTSSGFLATRPNSIPMSSSGRTSRPSWPMATRITSTSS